MNAMGGNHNKPQNQSGLGGLASSLLGGQGSHGGNGQGGSGGLAGQLVGGLLGGGKPHNQQSGQGQGQGQSGGHGQGGLMGMASGFLGGHHGSGVRQVPSWNSAADSFLGLQQQLWLLFHRPE